MNLEKDLFFLGDNGSGKTTVIRAIHYLYSGDVRNLGIPTDKDGFKEYYFKYENSYIIYVFEGFFIFMYKTGSEIVKIFSKQHFNLMHIIGEDAKLKESKELKRYAKSANLKKTVKSLNEYREVIYGNDKKFLDFKFTSIKNSDAFIGLFNEIFNIDKSIIDSKSIKQAIQTTLGYESKVMEFDHEYYLQNIYKYQAKYKFFREFEKQKKSIERAYSLKCELLEYENQIKNILAQIKYRYAEESRIVDENKESKELVENSIKSKERTCKRRKSLLEKCVDVYEVYFRELKLDISEIQRLKEKFSEDKLLENRDIADKSSIIEENYLESKLAYEKLQSGFEDELKSIDDEVKSLEYRRDKVLVRELEDKKDNKNKQLKATLHQNKEKLEWGLSVKKQNADIELKDLRDEIKQFTKAIEMKQKQAVKLDDIFREESRVLVEHYDTKLMALKAHISTGFDSIDTKEREQKNLKLDIEEAARQKEHDQKELAKEYQEHKSVLDSKLREYESMLEVKEGSFKAFLSEEVDSWERELYPVIDSKLLDMTDLDPKLVHTEKPFGIALKKENLKSILTKDEAYQKIEALRLELENLKLSYEESLKDKEAEFEIKKESIEEFIVLLGHEISGLKSSVTALKEDMRSLGKKLEEEQATLLARYQKSMQEFKEDVKAYRDEIVNSEDFIDEVREKFTDEERKVKVQKEIEEEEYRAKLKNEYDTLNKWKESEVKRVDDDIEVLELKKLSVSKDDRLIELENKVKALRKENEDALMAKNFLKEYESAKEKLDSFLRLKSQLEKKETKFKAFEKNLEYKIDDYEDDVYQLKIEKEQLDKRDKKLKKGINAFRKLELDLSEIDTIGSSELLVDLLEFYGDKKKAYINSKIDLKTDLSRINRLKNSQNDIDISFNLDEYDETSEVSENITLLSKIDEVYEYKNKKLEITKKSMHKKFVSFITELPQKMGVMNDGEDKFISQVAKINRNLSGIDFGVIDSIKLNTKIGDKKSIAKLLIDLNKNISTISSLLNETSLFYEKSSVLKELENLESKFREIKAELKGSSISLTDTIDLTLSFNENSKPIVDVSQLKNESSTGGSMLLKIAIAISILQIFVEDEDTPFFLIVDEVSRLHSDNQERLRKFANSKGFSIIFVTPEPTYAKPDVIKYYRFKKSVSGEFKGIELNR